MKCKEIIIDRETKKQRHCRNPIYCNFLCRQHYDNTEYGKCCYCNEKCNPCSQTCGKCARIVTGIMLGW